MSKSLTSAEYREHLQANAKKENIKALAATDPAERKQHEEQRARLANMAERIKPGKAETAEAQQTLQEA